jgi:hypothetical protein
MRATYAVLAAVLFGASALLGLFFLSSAGLGAGGRAMSVAWAGWGAASLAGLVGLFFAVRRLNLLALVVACGAPIAAALVAANLALRFGQ